MLRLGADLVLHCSPEQLLAGEEKGREKRRKGKKKEEKREERGPGEGEKGEREEKKILMLGFFGGQNPNI